MRQKYGPDGVVAIAVSVDDAADADARKRAEAFLEKVKAQDVVNLLLDEGSDVWQEKLKVEAPPSVFVFDQENRLVLKLTAGKEDPDYKVVEAKVRELL